MSNGLGLLRLEERFGPFTWADSARHSSAATSVQTFGAKISTMLSGAVGSARTEVCWLELRFVL